MRRLTLFVIQSKFRPSSMKSQEGEGREGGEWIVGEHLSRILLSYGQRDSLSRKSLCWLNHFDLIDEITNLLVRNSIFKSNSPQIRTIEAIFRFLWSTLVDREKGRKVTKVLPKVSALYPRLGSQFGYWR